MNRRPWEDYEDEYLRRYYKRGESMEAIRSNLDRTAASIYRRVRLLGIQEPISFLSDAELIEEIKRRHPEGWTDPEICDELKSRTGVSVNRHRVGRLRKRLGLTSNALSPRQRARTSAKTREQVAKAGVSTLAELRLKRWQKWKRDLGWPEELTVRAVQAAELFYRRGPMTRLQLCAAMGIDPVKSLQRIQPTSNAKGGTVLAELQRAGLVMRLPKQVPSGRMRNGIVNKVSLYLLCPGVIPNGRKAEQHAAVS